MQPPRQATSASMSQPDKHQDESRIVAVRDAVDALFAGTFDRMPYTARVLAENVVRNSPSSSWDALLGQLAEGASDADFPFYPARVVLQDLLGTPALVDLAGLRDAVAEAGRDPHQVNPVVPTQLVVDHSLNVELGGMEPEAMRHNMAIEQ